VLKRSAFLILISSLSFQLRAQPPLEQESNEVDEIESSVPDESHVKTDIKKPDTETKTPEAKTPEAKASPIYRKNEDGGAAPTRRQNEFGGATTEQKAPSGTGEPIFDWNKHQGETEVSHPFAEKGLIRITKDKEYIYKVDPGESHRAMSVQVGMLDPQNLRNPDQDKGSYGDTFKENYDQTSNPTVLITREWDEWVGALGKINLRVGTGAFVAQGHGHFVGTQNEGKQPLENLTFLAFPNSAGIVYRMQFSDRPLFIPFLEGGVTGWVFTEFRDDKKGPKFGVAPSAYGAGGVAINMTYFDYLTRIHIDREYGITGVYFTLEYRRMQAIVDRYDFSGDFVNGGFLMQY
jgi:hypothetical protein